MTTSQYDRLDNGPMDEIDAAVWTGDTFHNLDNIKAFRAIMARWERGLQEAEATVSEMEE